MAEPKEYDCAFTSEVRCPHCGEEQQDSWELDADGGECECNKCGKSFGYERHFDITYSTWKCDIHKNKEDS